MPGIFCKGTAAWDTYEPVVQQAAFDFDRCMFAWSCGQCGTILDAADVTRCRRNDPPETRTAPSFQMF